MSNMSGSKEGIPELEKQEDVQVNSFVLANIFFSKEVVKFFLQSVLLFPDLLNKMWSYHFCH